MTTIASYDEVLAELRARWKLAVDQIDQVITIAKSYGFDCADLIYTRQHLDDEPPVQSTPIDERVRLGKIYERLDFEARRLNLSPRARDEIWIVEPLARARKFGHRYMPMRGRRHAWWLFRWAENLFEGIGEEPMVYAIAPGQ